MRRQWIPLAVVAAALGLAENGVRPLDVFSSGSDLIFRPSATLFRLPSGPENETASNF
jgi:hypothetical protein